MARKLRLQYPGAVYHVMNRGDHSEAIFRNDKDRQLLLATLAQACDKTDWQVHALKQRRKGQCHTAAGGVRAHLESLQIKLTLPAGASTIGSMASYHFPTNSCLKRANICVFFIFS